MAPESKEKTNAARILEDGGSESEESTYLLPDTKVTAPPQWYLDSCASVHITPRKDQFISKLSPIKTCIEIADGTEVRSREGRCEDLLRLTGRKSKVDNSTWGALYPRGSE